MRRASFVAFVFLAACGHRNVRINTPQTTTMSAGDLEGIASYYAAPYHGRKTASGEIFDTYNELTAAHRTLPFNSLVRVTNETNGREVDVRINDRGPFIDGRIIDLSLRAAREIDLVRPGVAPVKLKVLKLAEGDKPAAYAVQVGAFESRQTAEDLRKRLEKKYSGVTIQTISDARALYRVRISRPDLEAATRLAAELRKQDFKPFVVRLN